MCVQVCVKVKDNGLMYQILHTDNTGLSSKMVNKWKEEKENGKTVHSIAKLQEHMAD